jgi:alpha-L-fucosidase 2
VPGVGSWGQLLEWITEKKDAVLDTKNDHHRHTSHLFAVFPGNQINYETAHKLADAAKVWIFQNLIF